MPGIEMYACICSVVVEAEDDTAADSDDGSTGGGRRDRNSSSKKTVAPLKIKINKKKKKRRGSDVRLMPRLLIRSNYVSDAEQTAESFNGTIFILLIEIMFLIAVICVLCSILLYCVPVVNSYHV